MRTLAVVGACWLSMGIAHASSCYDLPQTRTLLPYADTVVKRQVTVIIDQTTYFPADVRRQVLEQITKLIAPGTQIDIGSFSSYSAARYPKIDLTVKFENGLPTSVLRSVNRRARDILTACLAIRAREGEGQLQAAIGEQFKSARPTIGQSDIMSAVQQFSARIRRSGARDNIVLLATDGWENSSTESFYRSRKPRLIDPDGALNIAASRQLLADLGGARVYLVGLALVPGDDQAYMPSDLVHRLELFWTGYFRRSKAASVTIGKPLLLEDIR